MKPRGTHRYVYHWGRDADYILWVSWAIDGTDMQEHARWRIPGTELED
jgi:hypothetical protein